jgi:hypothetical protein
MNKKVTICVPLGIVWRPVNIGEETVIDRTNFRTVNNIFST